LCVWDYDVNEEVVTLEFEDGRIVTCTKDHKFLTSSRGWVAADNLTEQDEVVEIN
jgi:intein/homing endonuclease